MSKRDSKASMPRRFTRCFNPRSTLPRRYLINDLAFDKNGYLYVTDSFQATIWRVPPGGGAPQVWFQNAAIDGPFGPNGVRIDKKSEKLYFTVDIRRRRRRLRLHSAVDQ